MQRTTSTVYDLAGNVATTVDALGVTTKFVYDVRNRLIQRIEAYGTSLQRTRGTSYDAVGNVLTVTDPLGTVTSYTYDALNRPTQQTDASGTSLQRSTTTAYDAVGNVTSVTNAINAVTQYVYDNLNRRTQAIEAYNSSVQRTTTTAYDAVSNVSSLTDPNNVVTTFSYDALNRELQEVQAAGANVQRTLSMTYDAVGNVLTMTNGLGVVTAYVYDALNRPVTETDAYGTSLARTLTTNYDADDNVTSTVDALNNTTTYGYDALNRRISVKNPDGGTTTTGYDANDNVVSVTDPLNHTMSYLYDVLNRKTQSTDPRGGIVKWVYDLNDNVLSLTDPVNNVTQWIYDALNRQVQEIDPLSNGEFYVYDAVDRLTSVTDRNGQQITSSYDLLNRKTGETWYNAGGSQVNSLTFTYDANNNLLTASNNSGTTTMTYDALNRLASVKDSFGTSLTGSYDAADNRTQMQDSFGATTTRSYDALNRLTSLQVGGSGQTPLREDFTYTARDQVATQTRYSDLAGQNKIGSSAFGYDSVGRLTNLQHLDGTGNNVANYVNAFDLASRITSETLNGGTPTTYSYDVSNQLTNDGVTAYTYDLNGNRTMTGYATGATNELTSDGTWNYFHDQNGNLVGKSNPTTGEAWSYGYDNRNRLLSATQTTSAGMQMQATYVYDTLGQRIEKDVWTQSGGSTVTTRFAYDMGEIWADLTSANALQSRYVRGMRVLELLAWMASGTASWVLADRMASLRNVANNSGAVIDTISYDGYGNVTSETSPLNGGSYRYDNYRYDSESGFYHPDTATERYYLPHAGVWIGRDPLGFSADDPNTYRYCHNAPTLLVDPFGFQGIGESALNVLNSVTSRGSGVIRRVGAGIGRVVSPVANAIAPYVPTLPSLPIPVLPYPNPWGGMAPGVYGSIYHPPQLPAVGSTIPRPPGTQLGRVIDWALDWRRIGAIASKRNAPNPFFEWCDWLGIAYTGITNLSITSNNPFWSRCPSIGKALGVILASGVLVGGYFGGVYGAVAGLVVGGIASTLAVINAYQRVEREIDQAVAPLYPQVHTALNCRGIRHCGQWQCSSSWRTVSPPITMSIAPGLRLVMGNVPGACSYTITPTLQFFWQDCTGRCG